MSADGKSYRQILRSSSIMGGAAGLNYLIGIVRVKIAAVLLGPNGVGVVSLYTSAMGMVGTVFTLGIGTSAVREVARSVSHEDPNAAARTVHVLRRAWWATGIFGWLLAVLLARPIRNWLFGSTDHATAIAVLGVTLLFGAVSGGQMALLQGMRRIGDIEWANVLGGLLGTVVTIALYARLGEHGIVSALVTTSLISLALSYWFSKRFPVVSVDVSWAETLRRIKQFAASGPAGVYNVASGDHTTLRQLAEAVAALHPPGRIVLEIAPLFLAPSQARHWPSLSRAPPGVLRPRAGGRTAGLPGASDHRLGTMR